VVLVLALLFVAVGELAWDSAERRAIAEDDPAGRW
jgi:hypothetical protein